MIKETLDEKDLQSLSLPPIKLRQPILEERRSMQHLMWHLLERSLVMINQSRYSSKFYGIAYHAAAYTQPRQPNM